MTDQNLAWAVDAFNDGRSDAYATYRRYVNGAQPLRYATPRYQQAFSRIYHGFAYNRCAGVVQAHADRLVVEGFTTADTDEQIGDALRNIWQDNRMDARAADVHREMFTCGDAYVVIWPDTTLSGDDAPRIWPQRADQMRVEHDPERPGRIVRAARVWLTSSRHWRVNVYTADEITKWISRDAVPSHSGAAFPRDPGLLDPYLIEGETWPVRNVWGVVPVVGFHNGASTEHGRSELDDVIPIQDALNKTATDLLLAAELGGFPQKVILGLDSDDPGVLEGLRRIEAGLSKIITIGAGPDGNAPSIDEFTATNLGQLREVVDLFDALVSRVSRVPVHWLTMSGSFPSGSSLRAAESPFAQKLGNIQNAIGNAWEDVMTIAATQASIAIPSRLSTHWRPVEQIDIVDKWEIVNSIVASGVPLKYALLWNGIDPETVEQIVADADTERQATDALVSGLSFPAPMTDVALDQQMEADA